MTILDIARDLGLNPVKVSVGEYASPCPFCGGNDRFHVWPEKGEHGSYWCRAENKGGDAIQLLRDAKKMSFKEACDYLGKPYERRQRAHTPSEPKRQAEWTPRATATPAELWQERAAAFAESCHKELLQNTQQLAWLAARGITVESVKRFSLGWNPKNQYGKRAEWGVENETVVEDGKTKVLDLLVLHLGLVIPDIRDGRVQSLRIRRPEEGLDDRYRQVKGSPSTPMIIPPALSSDRRGAAWVVVESRLDAILIAQDAGDLVGAAALDSVGNKPDGTLFEALKASLSILSAHDYDAAGAKYWPWWQQHFPQADRWVVPHGKDPGDYRKEGGDIRAWVVAGLPPGLRPAPPVIASEAKQSQSENQSKTEGKGESFDLTQANDRDESKAAETETGTGNWQKKQFADFSTSDDVEKPEIIEQQLSGNPGQLAEPLLPYDDTWPPITQEQAREMGYNFHETQCETCGAPRIFLWPPGQKPPQVPKCCTKPPEKKEKRRNGRTN